MGRELGQGKEIILRPKLKISRPRTEALPVFTTIEGNWAMQGEDCMGIPKFISGANITILVSSLDLGLGPCL